MQAVYALCMHAVRYRDALRQAVDGDATDPEEKSLLDIWRREGGFLPMGKSRMLADDPEAAAAWQATYSAAVAEVSALPAASFLLAKLERLANARESARDAVEFAYEQGRRSLDVSEINAALSDLLRHVPDDVAAVSIDDIIPDLNDLFWALLNAAAKMDGGTNDAVVEKAGQKPGNSDAKRAMATLRQFKLLDKENLLTPWGRLVLSRQSN